MILFIILDPGPSLPEPSLQHARRPAEPQGVPGSSLAHLATIFPTCPLGSRVSKRMSSYMAGLNIRIFIQRMAPPSVRLSYDIDNHLPPQYSKKSCVLLLMVTPLVRVPRHPLPSGGPERGANVAQFCVARRVFPPAAAFLVELNRRGNGNRGSVILGTPGPD